MSTSSGMSTPLRRPAVLGLVLVAAIASCQEPTQITLVVRTNVPYRANVTMAMWSSTSGRIAPGTAPQAIYSEPWLSDGLLGDLVVTPGRSKDEPLTLRVVLGVGRDPSQCSDANAKGCIVARRRLSFVPHTRLRVPVVLWLACDGVVCGDDETCNYVGKCVPATVDPGACSSPEGCVLPGDPPGPGDAGAFETGPGDTGAFETGPGDTGALETGPVDASDGASLSDGRDAGVSVTELATGWQHTCALLSSGAVKCWGSNGNGELGDGTTTQRGSPAAAINLGAAATAIVSGALSSCALLTGGTVKCWGSNAFGQLGDSTMISRSTPVSVINLGGAAMAIAGGGYHTCAILSGGGVKCWGNNDSGQLGDGTTTQRSSPVSVSNLDAAATGIAGGGFHTCALLSSGAVMCWGGNGSGELGDGTTTQRSSPVSVSNLGATATAVVTGRLHTCALLTGGTVKCWGYNTFGQLGDGTTTTPANPVSVINLGGAAAALSGGAFHTCALVGGGVKCWGSNGNNEMGDGSMTHRSAPVPVSNLGGIATALSAAGAEHTCAVLSGGVRCWGRNTNGQLGDNTTMARSTPVTVLSLP